MNIPLMVASICGSNVPIELYDDQTTLIGVLKYREGYKFEIVTNNDFNPSISRIYFKSYLPFKGEFKDYDIKVTVTFGNKDDSFDITPNIIQKNQSITLYESQRYYTISTRSYSADVIKISNDEFLFNVVNYFLSGTAQWSLSANEINIMNKGSYNHIYPQTGIVQTLTLAANTITHPSVPSGPTFNVGVPLLFKQDGI